jgi:YegS/Rv2252/BmrU family lipid kinase
MTTETKPLAVVNPAAGGGRCGKRYAAALERLREAGVSVDVVETSAAGEATEVVREAYRAGRRRFIAVGGDGTSYEVVNGLFPQAAAEGVADRPRLGFLPMGTGNSFLRDFTEQGAEHSIGALIDGRSRPCDVLRLEHADGVLHFINLLSIGFVAEVNGLRARRFKGWGEAGYVAAVVTAVIGLHPVAFPMRVDGASDDAPMVFASFNNSRFTGGKMMMAPEARTDDGLIDFVRVAPLGRFDLLRTFPKIFKGTHILHPAVSTARVQVVEFALESEIDVMVDGEALRVVPKRLEVLRHALDVEV